MAERRRPSAPLIIDTHAHLEFPEYDTDRGEVIARALDAGIWQLNLGTTYDSSRAALLLAEGYGAGVYAAVGVHPEHLVETCGDESGEAERDRIRSLAGHEKVVAIGECGFDLARVPEEKKREAAKRQRACFEWHAELARELAKPLALHCREAYPELIAALAANPMARPAGSGVVHFFSGEKEDAELLLDLGYDVSFGGVITFTRDYDDLINYLPLDRILVETDAPYVAPVPYRGRRSEPLYVREVVRRLAEIKGVSGDEAARVTTTNARRLFGF